MKNQTTCPLIGVFFLGSLLPVYGQDKDGLLLTIPSFIAANVAINTPVQWKGREWQRSGDGKQYSWEDAKAYCQNLDLGGFTDWALPTKDELKSLVYCSNGTIILYDFPRNPWNCVYGGGDFVSPTIDESFSSHPDNYWSSTPKRTDAAWRVNFHRGGCGSANRLERSYVRCVR
jgi:hypothetical protein